MASKRTLTAPSSSSFVPNPPWKYRVFLSFNCEDARESFINPLLASLEDKRSIFFGDDDSPKDGRYLCQKLWKPLHESICAIVVISKAYAFSNRCLIELIEILKCRTRTGLKVFPVFYHVYPSDVQVRKGDFERVFADHRKSSEVDGLHVRKWRAALYEVDGLVDRWCVPDDRYVAGIIEDIKKNILRAFIVEVSNSSQVLSSLKWWGYPEISLPADFKPHNLVKLVMPYSCIECLTIGGQVFEKLKHIDLTQSQNLIETPNFREVPNLEVVELAHCTSLCKVHPSIELLKRLNRLNLRGCVSLERLPNEVGYLSSLNFLDLSRNKVMKVPDFFFGLSYIKDLNLSHRNLSDEVMPCGFNSLSLLESLDLSGNRFGMIPNIFSSLSSLRRLHLNSCDLTDKSILKSLCCLSSLEVLDLSGNNFTQIPDSVWQLSDLQELYSMDCSQLKLLSKLPLRLGHLHLKNCPSLYSFCDQIDTATLSDIWGTIDFSFWSVHFHHGKPYRILHLHRQSPLWIKLRAQIFDTFVACGLTMGHGTPKWFDQRSTPSFGTSGRRTGLDLDEDTEGWKGCAIFIDFEVHEHRNGNTRKSGGSNHTFLYFVCRFQIEDVSLREPLVLCVPEVLLSGRHGVWAYIPAEWFGEQGYNLDRWSVEASNATQNLNVMMKHYRLRPVRQHDLLGMYEALRSISPHVSDLQSGDNFFYGDWGTLRVSGPIEGNITLEANIRPTCAARDEKKGVDTETIDNLSDEEPGSMSTLVWDATDG